MDHETSWTDVALHSCTIVVIGIVVCIVFYYAV